MNLRQVVNIILPSGIGGPAIPSGLDQQLFTGDYSGQSDTIRATDYKYIHPDDLYENPLIGYDLWRGASLWPYAGLRPYSSSDPIHQEMQSIVKRANHVESISRWTKTLLGVAALTMTVMKFFNAGVDFIEDNSSDRSISESSCSQFNIGLEPAISSSIVPCPLFDGQVVQLR